jgi:hypothetical protein
MEKREPESTPHEPACEYCGHLRCDNCRPDNWLNLADGCCYCADRILREAQRRVF